MPNFLLRCCFALLIFTVCQPADAQSTGLQGELFSMRGRRMQSFVLNRAHQLNLSNLPAGAYLLRLTDGQSGAVRVEKISVLR